MALCRLGSHRCSRANNEGCVDHNLTNSSFIHSPLHVTAKRENIPIEATTRVPPPRRVFIPRYIPILNAHSPSQSQRVTRRSLPPSTTLTPSPRNHLLPRIAITTRTHRIARRLRSRTRSFGPIFHRVAVIGRRAAGAVGCICDAISKIGRAHV